MDKIKIALAGNPNCGKTTMFNNLTGAIQYVVNWPGVTVEKKEGNLKGNKDVSVVDLPGIYSLSPYTNEEIVSRDYLASNEPSAVLNIVDATNIERNLYLTTQILELGKPVVIALNMVDAMKKNGASIDTKKLGERLGCKVVETVALHGTGVKEAADLAAKEAGAAGNISAACFEADIESAITEMTKLLPEFVKAELRRWTAIKVLERDTNVIAKISLTEEMKAKAEEITAGVEKSRDDDIESIITNERYNYIASILDGILVRPKAKMTISDKIDRIVTNRILGLPIFLLVMWGVYYLSISTVGTMGTDWVNDVGVVAVQDWLTALLEGAGAHAVLIDCIVNGIIGGLGAVLGFVPQMAVLFFLLSILEDCGYMVRIAFVMDRIFRHFGLSGKSFIPLLISSGCGIPGIMASRTIENENDRRMTIMTTTWIPCGAKLPVIALMAAVIGGKLTGGDASFLGPLMYLIGICAVLLAAVALKKTKPFHGPAAPFVMELPQYHLPQVKTVLLHTWERVKGFMVKAGTILFVACIIMWFLSSYGIGEEGFGLVDAADSILAKIGGVLRYIFIPLGFGGAEGGWQAAAASVSGFSAKEAIVTTIGVLANVAEEAVEDGATVGAAISGWFPTSLAAFSFLLFNLLDSPCLAAIATMSNELNSRKWFWFAILFQNLTAYAVTLIIYQLGMLFVHGVFGAWTVVAFLLLAFILFAVFRKNPYKESL